MPPPLPRLVLDGARRGRPPAETLALIQPFAAQAGVTRVAVVSGLDVCPIPVVMVTRPLSASLSVTQGKGPTLEAAKVSGLMEAIEHYHAETVSGVLRAASERELEPNCVPGSRLAHRLARHSARRRTLWQVGRELSSQREIWVPFDLVHLDLRHDGALGAPSFVPNSNGLASGNSVEEATVHALYELIERHLVAKFYDLSVIEQERRRLVTRSIAAPECLGLIGALERAELALTLWDLTDELGIPCFLCELIGKREPLRPMPAARGFGCHGESSVALSRAVCEAAQSRVTSVAGSRDDMIPVEPAARIAREAATREQWQRRSMVPASHLFRSIPTRSFASFREECEVIVAKLMAANFDEPVLVDLSKSGWPVSVVRVIAPGLRFEPTESINRAPKEVSP